MVPTPVRSKAGEVNIRQWFKLSAGAGLVTMLLGALMVVAPGAGAALPVGTVIIPQTGANVPICHATNLP